ncbi:cilia- and flagella-associated protein 45-like [Corythoichthys intestinalis]|uniref:cilia- and flagella-associated protein 45-like n=1 Tax=Corythoichthys intestinalis TaxID=161448 RepID=UPI0025A52954|nr:cilia- and flagella-associated protein 45-like [Corythoichthys intestinalis]
MFSSNCSACVVSIVSYFPSDSSKAKTLSFNLASSAFKSPTWFSNCPKLNKDSISQVFRTSFRMDLKFKTPEKTTVICHQGFLYNIRMPSGGSRSNPVVLTIPEHERILANARGPNAIEREQLALDEKAEKKQEIINAGKIQRDKILERDKLSMIQESENRKAAEKELYLEYQCRREKAQMQGSMQIIKLDRRILNSKIQAERDKQLKWKKSCESVEHSREKEEFGRVLKCTQEALALEAQKNKNRQEEGRKHLDAIKKQVKEREEAAQIKRHKTLTDFIRTKAKWIQKDKWLNELKAERLQDFYNCGIPEEYRLYVGKKAAEDGVNLMDSQYRTFKTYDILPRWVTAGTEAMKAHIKSQNVEKEFGK